MRVESICIDKQWVTGVLERLRILIGRRGAADRLFEVAAEERLVGKVEHVAHLLYIVLPAFQQRFRFENDIVANPVAGMLAADVVDYLREVFGGNAQFFGIETDAPLLGIVLPEQEGKLVENLFLARNILGILLLDIGAHQLT